MKTELELMMNNMPLDDLNSFLKKTTSELNVINDIAKVKIDYSWIDSFEDALPNIDSLIRNPKRFIVNEEDVLIVEKTKKVSSDTIKHLATHTQLIRDIDEEEMVKPSKLLNVFKEDTIDLYENRFLYSLIKRMAQFLDLQLELKKQDTHSKNNKILKYKGKTLFPNQEVSINLNMKIANKEEDIESEEAVQKREERIKHISEIVDSFFYTKFMKEMGYATQVRSPIRRTNTILKDRNFRKCLGLWEFLDRYLDENPLKIAKEKKDISNNKYKNDFAISYFLNYNILNDSLAKKGSAALLEDISLPKTVLEHAKKFDVEENELKIEIEKALEEAKKYKEEQKLGVKTLYKSFIDNHYSKINKGLLLFK